MKKNKLEYAQELMKDCLEQFLPESTQDGGDVYLIRGKWYHGMGLLVPAEMMDFINNICPFCEKPCGKKWCPYEKE